jgi:predicted peroxiredoxin
MARYLLIESRDPFDPADVGFCHDMARRLVVAGNRVTLFLVQNGVLPARAGAPASGFAELAQAGVEILADDFSLRERGISSDRLHRGVKLAELDVVIDRLAEAYKAIWH